MSVFTPNTIHALNSRAVIDDAYTNAGLTPPSNVDIISEALASEPSTHDVAVDYATRSLSKNNDPEQLVAEAIAAITRAQAVDQFRDIYNRAVDGIAFERIDETRTNAAADLTPVFNRTIKDLQKAAAKLDEADPLDRDVAFNNDTTAAWKNATGILAALGHYSIADIPNPGNVTPGLHHVLGIVTIPDVEMEEYVPSSHGTGDIVDAGDPEHQTRNEIRSFATALSHDLDHALIQVARGKWEHISYSIADTTEAERRATAAHNALTRAPVATAGSFTRAILVG